jgi:hypothetical protein
VTSSVSAGQLRALRLLGQLLTGSRAGSVAAAAAHLGGLQAQAAPPAQLAVRARTGGLMTADVDRACGARRPAHRRAVHGAARRRRGRAGVGGRRHRRFLGLDVTLETVET